MGLTWFSRDLYGFIWVSNGFTIVLYGLMLVYEGGKEKNTFVYGKFTFFHGTTMENHNCLMGEKKSW